MSRLGWGLPILFVAACGMASAQTAPAAAQAQASTARSAVTPGRDAAAAATAVALSPQQQRLLDEADQIVDLAQKLKTEVDKTNQYTLSLNTLRRADDIEKLAKDLEKEIQHDKH